MTRLRWGVRAVLAFGLVASILANILHADRNPVSMMIAGITPLCLFLALELVTRLPVQRSALARGRWVATLGIAGIAAYVSYWHMVGVALRYGEPTAAAHLLPLAIDGLIIVATINLFELARPTESAKPEPKPQWRRPALRQEAIEPASKIRSVRDRPDRPQTVAAAVRTAIEEIGDNPEAVLSRVRTTHPQASEDTVRRTLARARLNGHSRGALADA